MSTTGATFTKPSSRRPRTLLTLAIVTALCIPTVALAVDRFPDVPATSPHHDNITAIAEANVTQGFPDGTYRPGDFVRRDQMGSFLARVGGLGDGNPPIANAATAATATTAATAADAELFAGQAPSAYTTTVFSETLDDAVALLPDELPEVLVITDLPAGEYIINAQATAHRSSNPNTQTSTVRCRIDVAGETQVRGEAREVGTEPDGLRRITFPLVAHVSAVPEGSDVQLLCAALSVVPADARPLIVGQADPISGDTVLIVTRVGD